MENWMSIADRRDGLRDSTFNVTAWASLLKIKYHPSTDTWRTPDILVFRKILPIPSGYAQGIMGGAINTRFGRW